MSAHKIYTDMPFDSSAMALLRDGLGGHELLFAEVMAASVLGQGVPGKVIEQVDIAFGQPNAEAIERAKKLRWLHVSSAGFTRYDCVDFRRDMAERGIVVTNSSSVYADACVDQMMAFLFAQSRQLLPNLGSSCAAGTEEWFALRESAVPLRGQRMVILGYGTIARRLTEVLGPYQMEIVAVRRSPRGDEGVPVVTPDGVQAALARADHVVNILPDNPDSRHYCDAEKFGWMKSGAVFYNIGRGSTVDQAALAGALRGGHLSAAWLDVTEPEPLPDDHELRACENCLIVPHTAGGHRNESHTLVRHFLENLRRFDAGESLLDRIM